MIKTDGYLNDLKENYSVIEKNFVVYIVHISNKDCEQLLKKIKLLKKEMLYKKYFERN